jgi:hypothetical protein
VRAAALALAAAAVTSVAAAGTPVTIVVTTKQGPTVQHAHPPATEVGDTFDSSLVLLNPKHVRQFGLRGKAKVGTMSFSYTIRSQCRAFEPTCRSRADIETTSTLPDGTIDAAGKDVTIAKPTISVTVTGGTGRYAGAHGTLTMGPASTGTNVYRLELRG